MLVAVSLNRGLVIVEMEFSKLLFIDTLQLKRLLLRNLEKVLQDLLESLEAEIEAKEAI